MTNKLTPTQVHELKQALRDKTNTPHHRKIQALILYSENQNLTASAKSVGFVHQTVRNLLNRYLDGGLQALLTDNRGGRRRAYMTQEEEEQFLNEQLSSALKGELVRLILFWQPIRQKLVEKRLEKDYTLS